MIETRYEDSIAKDTVTHSKYFMIKTGTKNIKIGNKKMIIQDFWSVMMETSHWFRSTTLWEQNHLLTLIIVLVVMLLQQHQFQFIFGAEGQDSYL